MSAAERSIAEPKPYDPAAIEPSWQARWAAERAFEVRDDLPRARCFSVLEALPRPGLALALGDVRARVIGDAIARWRRLRGFAVLHPIGWDSFGPRAEQAAAAQSAQPRAWTAAAIARTRAELDRLGFGYAWSRAFAASDAGHVALTQALFLDLVEAGLVYRMPAPATWSTALGTVLADEESSDGRCRVSGSPAIARELPQWFLRATTYADELRSGEPTSPLRDWSISRQRGWGVPIPYVYGEHSGAVPVRKAELPVTLPDEAAATLAQHPTWAVTARDGSPLTVKTAHGAEPARRETETMDPDVAVSWSFARFADAMDGRDQRRVDHWLPVDLCVVPAEHPPARLLHARVMQKALCDLGRSTVREPFHRVLRVGAVRGDAAQDEEAVPRLIAAYGADALRLALLVNAAPERELAWSDGLLRDARSFLDRLWSSLQAMRGILVAAAPVEARALTTADAALTRTIDDAVVRATDAMDNDLAFDRAFAACVDVADALPGGASPAVLKRAAIALLRLLAPLVPHVAAELWRDLGGTGEIAAGAGDGA